MIDLRDRTKKFALRVFALIDYIRQNPQGRVVQYQLAASSAAANYRAAQRSRSRAEFISKLNIVLEEIDESCFWIELLVESGLIRQHKLGDLQREETSCALSWLPHVAPRDKIAVGSKDGTIDLTLRNRPRLRNN